MSKDEMCDGSSDRSFMVTHWAIARSSQWSMTGVTMTAVCTLLGDAAYKRPLAANWKIANVVAAAGFLSRYPIGPRP